MAEYGGRGSTGSAAPGPPNRAVVSDNGVIRLMVYAGGIVEPLGVVELSPEAAARLAADLIGAAAARLERERNGRVGVLRGPGE